MNLCLDLCETFSSSASPKALLRKKRDEISFVLPVRGEDAAWGVCVCVYGDDNEDIQGQH